MSNRTASQLPGHHPECRHPNGTDRKRLGRSRLPQATRHSSSYILAIHCGAARSYRGRAGPAPAAAPSPNINTEDFSAAVDFLGLHPSVDRGRIGVIGICGFGGMALSAAAVDKRIKAVVTTSMYDMSRVMAKGYYDSRTTGQRAQMLEQMSQQRWADAEKGSPAPGPRILPETPEGVTDPVIRMYFDYYRTPRGFHERSPNSSGAWTATGPMSFMNFPLLTYIDEIAPRPTLLIAGENAHSRYFSEDAYKAAAEPKELMIIENANHVDLYDRIDKIPFDTISAFFGQNLKGSARSQPNAVRSGGAVTADRS